MLMLKKVDLIKVSWKRTNALVKGGGDHFLCFVGGSIYSLQIYEIPTFGQIYFC